MNLIRDRNHTPKNALKNSELRYRRLFETAQDGILILDGDTGIIDDANPFLLDMLNYRLDEMVGKQLWEIGLFRDRQLSESAFLKLRTEGYIRYDDLPLETKKGVRREVEFISNLYQVDGRMVIQCNIRDISGRKVLEAKLRQAEKMEVVGRLAGGIAHDYNNILTSTLLQLSVLLNDSAHTENTKRALRQLQEDARRAASLTRQLLLFSRLQVIGRAPLNLPEVLEQLLEMLRRLMSKHVLLEPDLGKCSIWIEADRTLIEQAVTNLCLNAQDAMDPEGGQLGLAIRLVELDEEAPLLNPLARAGLFACLEVSDTGCGIDAFTLPHLFEPFFTTKDVGKGTGLGLSLVYGIAKQHNGWVEVSSTVGVGTTFRVFLPALRNAPPPKIEAPAAAIRGGIESILLVEDERPVREMIALALRSRGYRVFEAASGPMAIDLWSAQAGAFDLLFADMRMPHGMTGTQLYERFKAERPTLKGVISSGYSDTNFNLQGLAGSGLWFLPKPYDIGTLALTVRNCLDQTNPPGADPSAAPSPYPLG